MSVEDKTSIEWVLPASIPLAELKGRDLEGCLYWLFDAMGAKDLEWRTGGTGGGASDGGRDLEAHFYTPTVDDELEPKTWWIECKGRSGTVEKSEVLEAVNNASARDNLDYLVIATNTQFSNPTREWVKEWQSTHKRPKVKLWDSEHLERLLSKHPDVVLRLFSEALSLQGRVQAMEARFWNRLEYTPPGSLEAIWAERENLEFSSMGMFAAIANEFSNGDITRRSWSAILDSQSLVEVMQIGLLNTPYLASRCAKSGNDQTPVLRAVSYLIMSTLKELPAEDVAALLTESLFRGNEANMPEEVREYFLMPIMDQMLSELQDVCSEDCVRMSALRRASLTQDNDSIETYWLRFAKEGNSAKEDDQRRVLLESDTAPCIVGFAVNEKNRCPLFGTEPTIDNVATVLEIIKRVIGFRIAQAKEAAKR